MSSCSMRIVLDVLCCSMWKNYLQLSKKQVVTEAYKWWFHLYDVCREQCRERNGNVIITVYRGQ